MDARARRIGENEALFRQVNDQIRELNESFATLEERMTLVCECGDETCIERIEVAPDDYRSLRSDSTQFAVRPGHEIPDVEDVVGRHDGYWVVRKKSGDPAALAAALDHRG